MKLEIITTQKAKVRQFTNLVQDLCTLTFGDNWAMKIDLRSKPTPDLYQKLVDMRDAASTPSAIASTIDDILAEYDQAVIDMEDYHD